MNGNVPFSGVTSATLIVCCFSHETAVVNTEEGGDDVKSAWSSDALGDTRATMVGTMSHANPRGRANLKTQSQFGLEAATRLHEAGIASNRKSATLR